MVSLLERNKNVKLPEKKKTMSEHAEDALYREVWEEVNAQKAYTMIKKYSRLLIAFAIMVLVIVVGYQLYSRHQNSKLIESAHKYEAALAIMDSGNPVLASAAFVKSAEMSKSGMADLAMYQAAGQDLAAGDRAAAIEKLTTMSKKANHRDFRDMAIVNLALLQGDTMTAPEFERMLAPIQAKRSPFYYTGLLLVGQKYLAESDRENANKWLDKIITDKDAPADIVATASSIR